IIIGTIWLASGLYCSPRLVYMVTLEVPRDLEGSDFEIICTARRTLYDSRTFDMINSILLFLIPLVLMSVLYCRVGLVLWRSSGKLQVRLSVPVTKVLNSSDESLKATETSFMTPPQVDRTHRVQDSGDNRSLGSRDSFDCIRTDSDNYDASSPPQNNNSGRQSSNYSSSLRRCSLNSRTRPSFRSPTPKTTKITMENHSSGGRNELKSRQSVVKMLIELVYCQLRRPYSRKHHRSFAIHQNPSVRRIQTSGRMDQV
ncbi:unnamed protein product, partial [Allacma fusca]